MAPSKMPGFTLTELKIALAILGLIALLVLPKVVGTKEDKRTSALVRESFTTIGEAFLARKLNQDYTPHPDDATGIGTSERAVFGQYLYKHLNYTQAVNPASVANYCTANAAGYFVLPLGTKITQICDVTTTTPYTLQVSVQIPKKDGTTSDYTLFFPKGEDRYTTAYGFNTANVCTYTDVVLGFTTACP